MCRVCASVTQGVPSCLLTIDSMVADVAGRFKHQPQTSTSVGNFTSCMSCRWSFEIEREVGQTRPRTLKQSVSVELVLVSSSLTTISVPNCLHQVELPSQLYLKYDGVEYRGGRDEVIVAKYSSSISPHPAPPPGLETRPCSSA